MRVVALTFALSAATATAFGALRSNAFLSSEMRPDMVARLMTPLVAEWKAQAHVTAECKTQGGLPTCDKASRAFHSSCSKVVRAVMLSSQGDSVKVSEYMTTVCSQKPIRSEKGCCGFVGQSIVAKMSANSADNRENHVAKADATCNGLWIRFVEEQTAQVAVEAEAKAKAKEEEEKAFREAAKLAEVKLAADMKAKAKEEKEAKAKEEKEAEASRKRVEDAKIQEAEQKVGTQVKTADSIEAHIKAAFKSAPQAKVQDAKIAADAKTADAKIQEVEKKVGEKVKAADAIETKIQAAFKSAVA